MKLFKKRILRREEYKKTIKAVDSLKEKMVLLGKGEKVIYSSEEWDVLLDMYYQIKEKMDPAIK